MLYIYIYMSVRAGNDLRKRVVSDKIGLNQLNDQIKDIDIESETEDKINSFLALAKKKAIKPIYNIYICILKIYLTLFGLFVVNFCCFPCSAPFADR